MEPEIINQEVTQNINQPAQSVPEVVFKKSKLIIFLAYFTLITSALLLSFMFLLGLFLSAWVGLKQIFSWYLFIFLINITVGAISSVVIIFSKDKRVYTNSKLCLMIVALVAIVFLSIPLIFTS